MIERESSPIFAKTYDCLLWLIQLSDKYPKSQRFRLAQRVEESAFAFYHHILRAVRLRDPRVELSLADIELEHLRLYIRLSRDVKAISFEQYEHAARMLSEIGKLLGGWLKEANEEIVGRGKKASSGAKA